MNELSSSAILRKLRPPYGQSARAVYGFSTQAPLNLGLTLEVPVGSTLVSPGDGQVDLITPAGARWRNDLGATRMLAVRIDHGRGIKTWVHGLGSVSVGYGAVRRGQMIGQAAQNQIFFAYEQGGRLTDPTRLNVYFQVQDGFLQASDERVVRAAPDLITRSLSAISSLINAGVTYLLPPNPEDVRFNLDFNGDGTKSGAAVAGTAADVWQVIDPLDFAATVAYGPCAGAQWFPADQGLFLNDWQGRRTRAYLTRVELTADAGVSAWFDPMLSTWMGGYAGSTPRLNSFTLRNVPRGTYRLLVYGTSSLTGGASSVTVSGAGSALLNGVYPYARDGAIYYRKDADTYIYAVANDDQHQTVFLNYLGVDYYSADCEGDAALIPDLSSAVWTALAGALPLPTVTSTLQTTAVYCGVDGGAPALKTLTPTQLSTWVADGNYVEFGGLVVSNKGRLSLAVYGFLAGLQLERTST